MLGVARAPLSRENDVDAACLRRGAGFLGLATRARRVGNLSPCERRRSAGCPPANLRPVAAAAAPLTACTANGFLASVAGACSRSGWSARATSTAREALLELFLVMASRKLPPPLRACVLGSCLAGRVPATWTHSFSVRCCRRGSMAAAERALRLRERCTKCSCAHAQLGQLSHASTQRMLRERSRGAPHAVRGASERGGSSRRCACCRGTLVEISENTKIITCALRARAALRAAPMGAPEGGGAEPPPASAHGGGAAAAQQAPTPAELEFAPIGTALGARCALWRRQS